MAVELRAVAGEPVEESRFLNPANLITGILNTFFLPSANCWQRLNWTDTTNIPGIGPTLRLPHKANARVSFFFPSFGNRLGAGDAD